jgi:hypothetical protein
MNEIDRRLFSDWVIGTQQHGSAPYHSTVDRRLQPPPIRPAEEQGRWTFEKTEVCLTLGRTACPYESGGGGGLRNA